MNANLKAGGAQMNFSGATAPPFEVPPFSSASASASPVGPGGMNMKIPGFILAVIMFIYSIFLFLPIGTKGGAPATGTAAKAVSETDGRRYSIPNIVFACMYLILSIFIGYQSYFN
jgi:hypothetical protein